MDDGLRARLVDMMMGRTPWPLYLWGPTGGGKTCATLALTDFIDESVYVALDDLAQIAFDRGTHWQWSDVSRATLVVVDEIGNAASGLDRQRIAIEHVYRLRPEEPTIWLSNHSPEKLGEVYDDRIVSRVCCGTRLEVTSKDKRFPDE